MGGAKCARCGTVSALEIKVCPRCGASLGGSSERPRVPRAPPQQAPRRAPAEPPFTAASPDDTVTEDEQHRRPAPAPRAPPSVRRPAGEGSQASLSGSRDSLIGQKLQEYVIEGRLGVGGMGVVYRAVHPLIGKRVAIKVLRPDVAPDPRDIDRLLEEARVVSAIHHRGIINIFGAGTLEDGRHYLIMDLLEGESLEQLMSREGQLPPGDAVLILEQTLSALAAAHEAGVVHRDLKPANVFLVKEGAETYVKLLDFGLARRTSQHVTRIAGTPDYISPEHARGRPAGPPADLYGFGVLCFHVLTGQLPFIGTTPMEVMEQHVHRAPPVPHEVNPAIPRALSQLILALLAKEPGDRPDAPQVKADLRAATKQLRTAPTMLSLASVPAVAERPEQQTQREARLVRDARVADLKRRVSRRWPALVGVAVGLWAVAVAAYVLWPTHPAPVAVRRPREQAPRAEVLRPPELPAEAPAGAAPSGPEAVAPPVAALEPSAAPSASTSASTSASVAAAAAVRPDEDAGPAPDEDFNAVLDDVRKGELLRQKDIFHQIEVVEADMKLDANLRLLLREKTALTRRTCETFQTLNQWNNCDDQVSDLIETYKRNR
jgi:serine/threonine protein kinase